MTLSYRRMAPPPPQHRLLLRTVTGGPASPHASHTPLGESGRAPRPSAMSPPDLGLRGRPAMRRAKSFFVSLAKSVPFAGEIGRLTAAGLFDPGTDWEVPQGAGVFARRLRGSPRVPDGESLKGPVRARRSGQQHCRGRVPYGYGRLCLASPWSVS